MQQSNARQLKPLEIFDATIIQPPLNGFLTNVSRELEKGLLASVQSRDAEGERHRSLLLIMLKASINSYETVCFLVADAGKDPKKLCRLAPVLPPINRQVMDTLFSLVYMLDEFVPRSLQYEIAGYRKLREIRDKHVQRFATDPEWQPHLEDLSELQQTMERYLPITLDQKADPSNQIRRWPPPSRLISEPTESRPFLEYVHNWLYDDTSAQSHMTAAGMGQLGGFVIASLAPDHIRRVIEERTILQHIYVHVSRMLIVVLAIATEIDCYFGFKNQEAASLTWTLLSGFVGEAKDVYGQRYQQKLQKAT